MTCATKPATGSFRGNHLKSRCCAISGTGKLDFSEFLSVFTKYQHIDEEQELQKAFQVFDTDADGFISIDELKAVLKNLGESLTEEEIQEMITEADTDGDGKVCYAGK